MHKDFITILMTAPGHTASKRFVKTSTRTEKIDFNAGKWFGVLQPQAVSDIDTLSTALTAVEPFPDMLVIRGAPIEPAYIGNGVRRLGDGHEGSNFETPPQGRHWILIDFDKIEIPDHLSLKKNPTAVCEYLVGLLPAEFHNVSYHWQMSSSAGMGDPSKVSMHIWFWLTRPIPDATLKIWAKAVNDRVGYKLIDPALFQHVQAHYTAAPIFEGMANPFPVRSGLHRKTSNSVDLVLPTTPPVRRATAAKQAANTVASGAGFDDYLSRIGDHPGGEGFHAPIIAAAASYVGTHGEDGTEIETLYTLIRDAVLAADARHHDPAYVERMADRDHIVSAIESALKKFGDRPSERRKARFLDGIRPHFESSSMSTDTAQQLLAEFANRKP